MKLIDAEALHTVLVKMNDFGELSAKKAIRMVSKAPTVEAIPVEWLESFRDGLDTLSESRLMLAIDLIIDAYRAEKKREEDLDYERASDMRDYCEKYEPTYNPEDGSL